MQLHGIRAKGKRRFKVTTDSDHQLPVSPNLLNREFTVAEPDKVSYCQRLSCAAQWPHNPCPDCVLLQTVLGLALSVWQQGVDRPLAEIF